MNFLPTSRGGHEALSFCTRQDNPVNEFPQAVPKLRGHNSQRLFDVRGVETNDLPAANHLGKYVFYVQEGQAESRQHGTIALLERRGRDIDDKHYPEGSK